MSLDTSMTDMLSKAIKSNNKKWHKEHVKDFFTPILGHRMKDQAAIDVLIRVGKLDCFKCQKFNGKTHVSNAVSTAAKKALDNFLYGRG